MAFTLETGSCKSAPVSGVMFCAYTSDIPATANNIDPARKNL
ncbi:hypothetical protein CPter291_0924 [Collimonas pratensis]|uniref:Lipoprotein n=1 Tax=Collimonas pratensis TaxID=279113 RepID=A0ABM5Z2M1_9BURK|nr:hypothetical protein CPter291_0924 [Collimonas pratensis]